MSVNSSKLSKSGYKWIRVSELFYRLNHTTNCSADYPGYEGLWCKLIMGVTSYAMMDNVVAIIHAPPNCAWAVRNFTSTNYSLYYGNPFLHMPSTNINRNSIIMGGGDNLEKTILEVDEAYKPAHICVFDSCSTALIADDITTIVENVKSRIGAKINYVPSAGFTAVALGKAIEEISTDYIKMMEKPETIISESVNILGQYKENFCPKRASKKGLYPDDAIELVRYIEALGLKVHRVLISGNNEYIKTAPQAALNLISCPTWGFPLAEKMYEEFGTPYLKNAIPMGIEATSKWIRELASYMNKNEIAEELIKNETEELLPLFYKTKELVEGKTALIECGRNSQTAFARPMALARLLQELGMQPYLFGLHPLELKAKAMDAEYFLNENFDHMILAGNYPYQQPINIPHIFEDLNLSSDKVIYFTEDVFPMAKSGEFDPSNTARVETGVHLRRIKDAPGRGVGFKGAKAIYRNIIEAVMASGRNNKASLYGRVHGRFYEFD